MINAEKAHEYLGLLYEKIIHDEYIFPEYSTLPVEEGKALSLKTHSAASRLLQVWDNLSNETS